MPKEFYTERDIEDLFRRGVMSLEVSDQVVLTELAYEKAKRLGMKLLQQSPDNPPAAPVRPYLSQKTVAASAPPAAAQFSPPEAVPDQSDLRQRIRSAVNARLGSQVDPNLLDAIIRRVLQSTGVK
jgi:hypothetical protein